MATIADAINDQLIRLGYSTFSGDAHGFEAFPGSNPAIIVMGHPTRRFDIAAYNAQGLLTALEQLPDGTDWNTMRAALSAQMEA